MNATRWADTVRQMLDRESVMLADALGVNLTPVQIVSLRQLIVLDWIKRKVAEEERLLPTVGDLLG